MSDAPPPPAPEALVAPEPLVQPAAPDSPSLLSGPPPWETEPRDTVTPRARVNTLAVAALILAVLLSPLAALFGHIAVAQISRSHGRERGSALAWIAVGLGYLWCAGAIVVGVAVWRLLEL